MGLLSKISNVFRETPPQPKTAKRAFQASNVDRLTSSWTSSQTNINADIRAGNQILRARARDLVENDPYARKFIRLLEKNVVGPDGFTFQNKAFDWIKDKETGESKKQYDKYANSIIEEAWAEWSKKENCTITRDVTLREASAIELKTIATDGEIFLNLIEGKSAGNKFNFTYQQIDPALCDERYSGTAANGNRVIMGIEYDDVMRPVAYYFKKVNALSMTYASYYSAQDYIRIPAENIIHLYRKDFVGQLRGISWFLPSAYRLNILKGYQEAVLINARSAAMKTGVLVPKDVPGTLDAASIAGGEENSDGDIVSSIEPGETYVVPEGYNFDTFDPSYPSGAEGPFTQAILQGVSAGWDVDYPTLSANFKDVNYTSSRSALLDARAGYKTLQNWLINHKMLDLFYRWLDMSIVSGVINLPITKIEKFNKPFFLGFRGEWVDAWKEAKADAFEIDNNLETLERTLAKRGYSLEDFILQKKREKKMLEEAGLIAEPSSAAADETANGNLTDGSGGEKEFETELKIA